ncbi:MAG: glycerol-3-phosphate dehydrogenase, anaerobic, subunit [Firmicutes bacterium]|nr:glycerol-3-phosphate dehydrogenase, anaerobic, subunit [Bacillota bacterium]
MQATVVVIGGGATGVGILRDLSMRGIKTVLVEQKDLAYGTSSRFHGLLHSGGRYAVKDAESAQECIEENTILRKVARYAVEETEPVAASF